MTEGIDRRGFLARTAAAALLAAPSPGLARAAAAMPTTRHGFNDAGVDWRLFGEGAPLARAESKPVFLLVHATWCHSCRTYRKVFFDPDVTALLSHYVCVLVDKDAEPAVAARFAESGPYTPKSLILTPEAEHLADLKGTHPDAAHFIPHDTSRPLQRYLRMGLRRFGHDLPELELTYWEWIFGAR